jgi:hypothetical protein
MISTPLSSEILLHTCLLHIFLILSKEEETLENSKVSLRFYINKIDKIICSCKVGISL